MAPSLTRPKEPGTRDTERTAIDTHDIAACGSHLLSCLPPGERERLASDCRRIVLARDAVLADAGERFTDALFPECGVASVVKRDDRMERTEICLVGREGFVGVPLLLGDGQWPYRSFVQTERMDAVALPAAAFGALAEALPVFRSLLFGAVQAQMVQIAEGLASAAWQRVPARLARWLLMYRDREASDRLEVTHEFIATMIGVQRTGITAALHQLEGQGLVTAGRGRVVVRDADGLARLADGSYGIAEREAARLLNGAAGTATPPGRARMR